MGISGIFRSQQIEYQSLAVLWVVDSGRLPCFSRSSLTLEPSPHLTLVYDLLV
jgi:hypothetical protein